MVAKKKTAKKTAKAAPKGKKTSVRKPSAGKGKKAASKTARKVVKKAAKAAASPAKKTSGKTSPKSTSPVARKVVKKAAKKIAKKAVKKVARKTTAPSKAGSRSGESSRSKASPKSPFQGFASISPIPPAEETPLDDSSLIDLTEQELGKCKSGLKARDLRRYREILMEKRAELIGDVESIEKGSTAEGGNLSHMPVHMADIGSDAYEQEFNLGLLESERKLLREIEQALMRIDKGYYGICMLTGQPIERGRLEIKPWARYSIDAVRRREKAGLS